MRRIVAGASILMLTGCGAAAIPVDPPRISNPSVESVCAKVTDDLPTWLDDLPRRDVDPETDDRTTPATETTAAWGEPAAILRCGVAEPEALRPNSACTTIEGVDWFAEEAERGYVFTTVGREARIEVSVPDDYHPESDLLVDLAAAIDRHNPVRQPCV